jgi:cytoskeletal protein CcmA (bactofilin family)
MRYKIPWMAFSALGLAAVVALAAVPAAGAAEILSGGQVVIGADEVIEDDLYVSAGEFVLDGTVRGDLVVTGGTITVNGKVEGDVMAAGQAVYFNGIVDDDVRAAGAVLILGPNAAIGDDALLGGFSIEAQRGATIAGDLILGGSQALLVGDVGGDLVAGAGSVAIYGTVAGDTQIEVGAAENQLPFSPTMFIPGAAAAPSVPAGLTIGDQAALAGDLNYTSPQQGSIADGAVAGQVNFERQLIQADEEAKPSTALGALWKFLINLASYLIVALVLMALRPRTAPRAVEVVRSHPWASLGWGTLALIVLVLLILALLAAAVLVGGLASVLQLAPLSNTILAIGALAAFAVLVLLGVATYWAAPLVMASWAGQGILRRIWPSGAEKRLWPVALGVLILAILVSLPWVGGLIRFAIVLFGLGAITLMFKTWWQNRPRMVPEEPPPAWF